MKNIYISIFVATAISILSVQMAHAGKTVKETWTVTNGGGCVLVVVLPEDRNTQGTVAPKASCKGALKKARSLSYVGGKRRNWVLQNSAGNKTMATLKRKGNQLTGTLANGSDVSLFLTSATIITININTGSGSSSSGNNNSSTTADTCKRYANNRNCVHTADLSNPSIATFKTVGMKSLSQQDVYPFDSGRGFAKDEKLANGICVQVKRCSGSGTAWCEVVLSDGFFTGWVKRMDADFVYLRKGC